MKKYLLFNVILSALLIVCISSAAAGPVMQRIVKSGKLVVGTTGTQPPLSATSKTGEIMGLDADIAKLIARDMEVTLEFKTLPFADLLPALAKGQVDLVISSMTITPIRNRQVAFIGPYYVSGKGILTKKKHIDKPLVCEIRLYYSPGPAEDKWGEFVITTNLKAKKVVTVPGMLEGKR